jgi:hypothetical protein
MNFLIFISVIFNHLILSTVSNYTRADGWTFNDVTRSFYQLYSKNSGLFDASNSFCKNKNSNLASINSENEFSWLQTFINTNNSCHVWVFNF